jgi:hypothetical protein
MGASGSLSGVVPAAWTIAGASSSAHTMMLRTQDIFICRVRTGTIQRSLGSRDNDVSLVENRFLESRPKAAARLGLELSDGWASPCSRGLWVGRRSATLQASRTKAPWVRLNTPLIPSQPLQIALSTAPSPRQFTLIWHGAERLIDSLKMWLGEEERGGGTPLHACTRPCVHTT